jgi:hypothetical protein
MQALPRELLDIIFGFVDPVARCRLACCSSLWQKMYASLPDRVLLGRTLDHQEYVISQLLKPDGSYGLCTPVTPYIIRFVLALVHSSPSYRYVIVEPCSRFKEWKTQSNIVLPGSCSAPESSSLLALGSTVPTHGQYMKQFLFGSVFIPPDHVRAVIVSPQSKRWLTAALEWADRYIYASECRNHVDRYFSPRWKLAILQQGGHAGFPIKPPNTVHSSRLYYYEACTGCRHIIPQMRKAGYTQIVLVSNLSMTREDREWLIHSGYKVLFGDNRPTARKEFETAGTPCILVVSWKLRASVSAHCVVLLSSCLDFRVPNYRNTLQRLLPVGAYLPVYCTHRADTEHLQFRLFNAIVEFDLHLAENVKNRHLEPQCKRIHQLGYTLHDLRHVDVLVLMRGSLKIDTAYLLKLFDSHQHTMSRDDAKLLAQ